MSKSTRPYRSRLENPSDEEIQRRWRALLPLGLKWFVISALSAPGLFLLHHYWQPAKPMADILSVVFRIAVGGMGIFAFLVVMALVFSRPKLNK
jgi:hypothetical protein